MAAWDVRGHRILSINVWIHCYVDAKLLCLVKNYFVTIYVNKIAIHFPCILVAEVTFQNHWAPFQYKDRLPGMGIRDRLKDKTAVRPFHYQHWDPYTGKTSLYWDGPLLISACIMALLINNAHMKNIIDDFAHINISKGDILHAVRDWTHICYTYFSFAEKCVR